MKLTIPLYIETGKENLFSVRPLFFDAPLRQHEKLERAMTLIAQDLRRDLTRLGEQPRHEGLAAWTFNPPLETHRLEVAVELRKRTVQIRLLFATFEALGRRIAFSPSLPEVWFELNRGDLLPDRANEALTAHFRQREREDEELFAPPENYTLDGTAWITPLELDLFPRQKIEEEEEDRRVSLGDETPLEGERELYRVGRCLDDLYPDDLDRALLREREVEELTRLLQAPDRRPVLLLGPPLVGKTTVLHEYVYRAVAARKDPHRQHPQVWLLSPQRLISGMSFVGQWENRLLAILRESKRREHVLYFDDFLGLYQAGQTSQSDLSIAHVLKPYVERREIRLVAEMSTEAFRVLRERDRGFADLFHVLPIGETTDGDTLRILIAVIRQLEAQHRSRFRLEVLPVVIDLVRRYVRHQVFPGKAAVFLRRLAVKFRTGTIARNGALWEFYQQTGLSLALLDTNSRMRRQDILNWLQTRIVGQTQALEAAADVISVFKARLNDQDRPLASFLFLGPTGVGKTETAKAISHFLFGDPEKILRFDMNEYLAPGSAARLVGTFDQPEGLLTAAVRRQPFSVVLLDEIEKAHPEVTDLLLQVLGEGRLTDALGRTVDFGNCLIILTSNLGVREASQTLGLVASHNVAAYEDAARRFFRPEFFNRLDRIVPFERLSRDHVAQIARKLMADLLQREGLVRRKCVLRVETEALERIIDRGYDPVLGARALKRTVERQLAQPVAAHLAAGIPETITVISVFPAGKDITIDVQGLAEVERSAAPRLDRKPEPTLKELIPALRRIEERFAHLRPRGEITAERVRGEQLSFYFVIQEQVRDLRQQVRDLEEILHESKLPAQRFPALPVATSIAAKYLDPDGRLPGRLLRDMAAVEDLQLYLHDLAQQARKFASPEQAKLHDLVRQAALLETMASASDRPDGERVLLYAWTANQTQRSWSNALFARYMQDGFLRVAGDADKAWWKMNLDYVPSPDPLPGDALLIQGLAARQLTAGEVGTHLFCPEHVGIVPVQVHVWPLEDEDDPLSFLKAKLQERRGWLDRVARGEAAIRDDPLKLESVVRIYTNNRTWVDLRTGIVGEGMPVISDLVMQSLPVPQELEP